MARTLIPIETCDLCKRQGLPEAEAQRSVHLSIDGPPKRYELCPPHIAQLRPFWELYADEEYGVDESLKPKTRATKKQATPELHDQEPDQPRQLEMVHEAPAKPEKQAPKKKAKTEKKDLWVLCPLPHKSNNGESLRVRYGNRSTHALTIHEIPAWDIKWEDPDGILKFQCGVHPQCIETGFSFLNENGLKQHIHQRSTDKVKDVA